MNIVVRCPSETSGGFTMTRLSSRSRRPSFFVMCTLAGAVLATPLLACSSDDDTSPGADAGTTPPDAATTADASSTAKLPFKLSNVDLSGVDLSKVADVDITSNCTLQYSSTGGIDDCDGNDFVFAYLTQGDQSGVGVYIARSIHIEPGVSINVDGSRPLVLVSLTTFLDQGTIDVSGDDLPGRGGAGGYSYSGDLPAVGLGPGGGGSATETIAGGGGSNCGIGGAGVNVAAGGPSVAGGPAAGNATIIPLVGGSTGGAGVEDPGGGGGALQIVAGTSFTLDAQGKLGAGGGPGNESGDSNQMAAGGGSGGAILIEAPTVTISGTIAANGGGGGGNGGDGTNGSTVLTAAPGGGVNGGAGSAGTTLNGSPGTMVATDDPGAGGGGAGWIRINTTSGAATITGMMSPAITTSCVTQGKLTSL
jgi:hypothetical protein